MGGSKMWMYTAYIFKKYWEKKGRKESIRFEEFANFMFNILYQKYHLIFHDGTGQLFDDLKLLEQFGALKLSNPKAERKEGIDSNIIRITDESKLIEIVDKIIKDTKNTPSRIQEVHKKYNRRIQSAINEID